MAEPLEVCIKGKDDVIGYACPTCKLFCSPMIYACKWEDALKAAFQHATECCDRHCTRCDAPLPGRTDRSPPTSPWPYTICPACKETADKQKAEDLLAKAAKVPEREYTGVVYWEDGPGPNEGYFHSIEELREHVENDPEDLPEWVWACNTRGLKLNAENILENELSNHYEDAYEDIGRESEKALQGVLDQWVTEHADGIQSWDPDYSRIVVLTKESNANETGKETPQGAGDTEEAHGEGAGRPSE